MTDIFKNSAQLWSALIIDQFVKNDVTDFFPSPGMRNAPLLKAISLEKKANIYVGIDERAQSYRALAHIKVAKKPAVLICTSGTALANYLPAIIEARKTHLPLFVLSADRPGELLAADANQTIDQIEVLRNYTKSFWQASEPQSSFPPRALSGKLSFLINDACKAPMGPLHINIPLREPLDDSNESLPLEWRKEIEDLLENHGPSLELPPINREIDADVIDKLIEKLSASQKPLIIFGPLDSWEDHKDDKEQQIKTFIETFGGNFSCDVTSGLKYSFGSEQGLIPSLDHPEVLAKLHAIRPDLIVHFGHRLTSKHYYSFLKKELQNNKDLPIVLISDGHFHEDPGFAFTQRWNIDPCKVISQLNEKLKFHQGLQLKKRPFFNWQSLIEKKRQIIEEGALSYPFLSKKAVETLSSAKSVFIGNSTFIRSFDSYAGIHAPSAEWKVLANRGASGIEGHVSMTLGMAERSQKPCVSFVGDVSLMHDLSSLIKLKEVATAQNLPVLLIVANNFGGGIFKLLPIAKNDQFDYLDLLTTPHQQKFSSLINAIGIPCQEIQNKEDYLIALEDWNKSPQFKVLEVLIKDEDNAHLYDQLKTVKL